MLSINNYGKTYNHGKTYVVRDVNLEIAQGDIYGFIGHNGAGKTTTIKSVVGVLPFEKGTIEIGGYNIKTDPIAAKKITAYIPDDPQLYDNLSGNQYLNFIADVFDVNVATRKEKITHYSQLLGIASRLNDPIKDYSHGMKQKLEITASLIHDPKLLVLDEPFVGLDPQASFILKNLMHEFCAAGGAIFFSTHVLEVAEKLCNKIAIIKNGVIVASGDMESVKGDSSLENVFLELIDHE